MDFLQGIVANRSAPAEDARAGAWQSAKASPDNRGGSSVSFSDLARSAREEKPREITRLTERATPPQVQRHDGEDTASPIKKLVAEVEQLMGKLEDVAPGKTAEEAAIMKALQTRNVGNLTKAFEKLALRVGDESSAVSREAGSAIQEKLFDGGSIDEAHDFAEVLGGLLAKFDDENGTRFLKNFTKSIEALNMKLDAVETDAEKSELLTGLFGAGESLASGLSKMMGVERPVGSNSSSAAPFTRFALIEGGVARDVAGDRAPLTMPGLDPAKPSSEAGILKLFENVADAGRAAKALMSTSGSGENTPIRPTEAMASRVEVLNSIGNTSSGASVSQGDFEELLQKASQSRADTPAPGAHSAQASRFSNLIANQLRNAQFTQNKMKVELAPRGLGDIEINVETDTAGKLRAMIRVENPMVLDMLRSDKTQLQELLQSKGLQLSSDDLEFSERETGGGQGGDTANGEGSAGNSPDEDAASDTPQVISSSNIDIRI